MRNYLIAVARMHRMLRHAQSVHGMGLSAYRANTAPHLQGKCCQVANLFTPSQQH